MSTRRRVLLLSTLAIPFTFAAALADDPWWDAKARDAEWQRERDIERRNAEARHQRFDENAAHAAWEKQAKAKAEQDWRRAHPGR